MFSFKFFIVDAMNHLLGLHFLIYYTYLGNIYRFNKLALEDSQRMNGHFVDSNDFQRFVIAKHPEVQERAGQEVLEVLKKHSNEITDEAIMDMKYLEQTIHGEEGTVYHIIHHDPAYYPDPERFDPDRFAPEEIKKRHPMSFIPFGDGPRNCIRLRFGVMQTLIELALILENYRIKLCDKASNPLKFSMKSIILAPEGGVWLHFDKIKETA